MTPKQLRQTRHSLGLTQETLAQQLHKTRLTITRYETGVLGIPQVVEMTVVQLSSSQISLAGIVAAGEPIEPIPQTERVEVPKNMWSVATPLPCA